MTSRRQFLRGLGGALVPVPFLPSLARGAAPPTPHPLLIVRVGNGVSQRFRGEPLGSDRFWPLAPGPLTAATLGDRAVSELAAHAGRLALVRGTDAIFPPQAEAHAQAGNQLLVARPPGDPQTDAGFMTYARGESVDTFVARQFPDVNRGEPLALYTGRRAGFGEEVLSYRGPGDLRAAEDDPWAVYRRLLGGGLAPDRRGSLNDLVLDQLDRLLKGPQLSADDRARLERHADAIWDFEVLCRVLPAEVEQELEGLAGLSRRDEHRIRIAELHLELAALAVSCDLVRAVTLQIGDRADQTEYEIDGVRLAGYHGLSHRTEPGDAVRHHHVDRLHLRAFRTLLDRLDDHGLLDTSVAVFVSELGNGWLHEAVDLPWVIAGAGDGTLRQGVFVDAGGGVSHHHVLNTLIAATGVRRPDGGTVDFGDESLAPGLLDALVARRP